MSGAVYMFKLSRYVKNVSLPLSLVAHLVNRLRTPVFDFRRRQLEVPLEERPDATLQSRP